MAEDRSWISRRWAQLSTWVWAPIDAPIERSGRGRRHRALTLLGVFVVTLWVFLLVDLVSPLDLLHSILTVPVDGATWKDRIQALVIFLGLPVAFLLWHWRDSNVREQIENQRKDINLKEFQEVQLRASGALDTKLPAEAREQLQIAALHQLRGFLRGEYGDSFRRPAFELLLAGHAAATERVGHLNEIRTCLEDAPESAVQAKQIREIIETAKGRLTPVDRERLSILRDEAAYIFGDRAIDSDGTPYPLNGRRLDWIELQEQTFPVLRNLDRTVLIGASLRKAHLKGVSLVETHLEGAILEAANLEGVNLRAAHLEGAHLGGAQFRSAHLREARFQGASLWDANLEGANLRAAHFEHAFLKDARLDGAFARAAHFEYAHLETVRFTDTDLGLAHFESADLRGAHLEGAMMIESRLDGADLEGAHFSAATVLARQWDELPEAECDILRQVLLDRGAIRSDLPSATSILAFCFRRCRLTMQALLPIALTFRLRPTLSLVHRQR